VDILVATRTQCGPKAILSVAFPLHAGHRVGSRVHLQGRTTESAPTQPHI